MTDPLDRLERLFHAARMHPPDERAAFLDAACAHDPSLRRELESLLAADEAADEDAFLDAPLAGASGLFDSDEASASPDASAMTPSAAGGLERRRIGSYTVLRKLGRGGMGDVYLAVRDAPFKQYAALKVIRRGMDTEEVLQRFEMERQILASLSHPNIARLLDGGVTEDGLPYFVMEYVDGLPLTTYCDQSRVDVSGRLRLFQTVCQAVQYAHQNLIIHRDLKPNNILVTREGVVKLLDFGVAKLLNPSMSPVTMPVTRTELRLMTPEYASPEQVRGEPLTTASDVYALGVILYELLTGRRPYRFSNRSVKEVLRIVGEQEPTRPSTCVTTTPTTSDGPAEGDTRTPPDPATMRGVSTDRLRRILKGDLDNIILTALRKETNRRYGSAEQLGLDIGRYLAGLPVEARPATIGYRMGKFVRRHRVVVGAAVIAVLALVSGSGLALWQSGKAHQERDRAQTEAQKAAQVTAFVLSLFETADPATAPGDTLRVRDVLEAGASRVERQLEGQPLVQAELYSVIAQAYENLGRLDRAERLFEQALALRRAHLGPAHEEVATTMMRLAALSESQNDLDAAEERYDAYVSLVRERYGPSHPAVLLGLYRLWGVLHMKGQPSDSLFALITTLQRELPAMDNPVQAQAVGEIGEALYHMRRYEEAEALTRDALAMERRLFGDRHPRVADRLDELVRVLNALRRYAEAEQLAREAVALQQALHPNGHADVITSIKRLSDALVGLGRPEDAEALFRQALAALRTASDNPLLEAQYLMPLAQLLVKEEQSEEAESLYRRIAAIYETHLGPYSVQTVEARERLGDVLRSQERFVEAEALLLDSYRILRERAGDRNLYTRAAIRRLVDLYAAWGRPLEAARYEAMLGS